MNNSIEKATICNNDCLTALLTITTTRMNSLSPNYLTSAPLHYFLHLPLARHATPTMVEGLLKQDFFTVRQVLRLPAIITQVIISKS